MNSDEYQVHIEQSFNKDETSIYIYRRGLDGRKRFIEAVDVTLHEIEDGQEPIPALRLPGMIANEVLQAIADSLDRKNIKTDKDAKIEGTLEATRYHLEDLRTLLKVNKGGK